MLNRPRVVLYNPRAVFFTMPLALVAIASALDRDRVDVVIIDGRLEADPVAAVVAAARGALCVGVTVLTGAPIHDALAVSRAVKAAEPSVPDRLGRLASVAVRRASASTNPSVDIVVSGQGEDTFRTIVDRLIAGERRGRMLSNRRRRCEDLNEFPAHDYSLIPVERYFALKGARQIDYISSQGCRFRCAFCADPAVFARGWTGLAPERIADEIAFLHRRTRSTTSRSRTKRSSRTPPRVDALADEFLRRNLPITWTATLRADQACRLGDDLFAKTVRSGLRRVMVGVESGSQEMLDRLQKDMKLEQVRTDRGDVHAVTASARSSTSSSASPANPSRACRRRSRSRRSCGDRTRTSRRRSSTTGRIRAIRWRSCRPSAATCFRAASSSGPTSTTSAAAARGSRRDQWQNVERFKFYTRHAWKPGAWRWPLRAASQWRCDHDWYDLPVEKLIVDFVRPPQQVS